MKPKKYIINTHKLTLSYVLFLILTFVFWLTFLSDALSSEWLPKDKWSLEYVSSEQLVDYDEKAINAFDGNPTTHWFSRWKPDPIPYPQEIQINLGSSYTIDGFSYLTRQITGKNGRVKDYRFYVSQTPSIWGAPLATGSFPDTIDIQIVELAKAANGQYIKFEVLSDHSGSTTYAQAAEIGVRGTNFTVGSWIPKDKWKLLYVNTEETIGADHRAINAFDSNPDTLWHSEWKSIRVPHPHELQIDLGEKYLINSFSYLPRQKDTNWHVKDYQFYISENKDDFGTPVATGSFSNGRSEKVVSLSVPKQGRYIRFVVLSDLTNSGLNTSVAEIGIGGIAILDESDLKVTFSPSPDTRATGHNFYMTNVVTNSVEKVNLHKEVVYIIPKGTLETDTPYRLTATAYGTINNKLEESVHSEPLYVQVKPEELILLPPKNFRFISLP